MMNKDIGKMKIKEIEDELKKRKKKKEREEKPKMLEFPDFERIKKVCQGYIDDLHTGECDHNDCDCVHYIFEDLMEACFGKKVWDWINKRR